jgi:hypothetical protein
LWNSDPLVHFIDPSFRLGKLRFLDGLISL